MTSPIWFAVGPYLKKLNVCPFDYTTVAVSGKVERS